MPLLFDCAKTSEVELLSEIVPRYTLGASVEKIKSLSLDDGTFKVFINATSKQKNISPGLRSFLNYLFSGLPSSELTDKIEQKNEQRLISIIIEV